jgi:hypothetical protein
VTCLSIYHILESVLTCIVVIHSLRIGLSGTFNPSRASPIIGKIIFYIGKVIKTEKSL